MINAGQLKELLFYDPLTGEFVWRVNRRGRGAKIGNRAGTRTADGRWQIRIDQKCYEAGRLAFLWMTGEWPKNLIDHIDCAPLNNRWKNLREATYSENGANSRDRPGLAPLKGVTWDRSRKKYAARIRVNYRTLNLGRFDNAEEAHAAYVFAAKKYFGSYARAI
jgi:hypothetical protein